MLAIFIYNIQRKLTIIRQFMKTANQNTHNKTNYNDSK